MPRRFHKCSCGYEFLSEIAIANCEKQHICTHPKFNVIFRHTEGCIDIDYIETPDYASIVLECAECHFSYSKRLPEDETFLMNIYNNLPEEPIIQQINSPDFSPYDRQMTSEEIIERKKRVAEIETRYAVQRAEMNQLKREDEEEQANQIQHICPRCNEQKKEFKYGICVECANSILQR